MELADILKRRRMVRSYLPDAIPREAVERIVSTVRRAPSGGSAGPPPRGRHRPETRGQLARLAGEDEYVAAGGQAWISTAPVHVFVGTREESYHERYRKPDKLRDGEEIGWPAPYWYVDAGAAFILLQLAAIDEGLASGVYGVLPKQVPDVKALLGVPDDVHFVCLVTIGRPATDPQETGARLASLAAPARARRARPLGALGSALGQREAPTRPARSRARVSTTRSTSASVVDQFDTEIRSRRSPRQVVAPIQHVPSSWIARSSRSVRSASPTRTSTWLRTTSFTTSTPSSASRRVAKRRASAQQRSTSSATPDAPQRAKRRPGREAARAPRRLGYEVAAAELAPGDLARQVRRRVRQRRRVNIGMRAERIAGVVRDVEPLVAVARPRVGQLDAAHELGRARARRGPEPERAVDVEPRPGAVGRGGRCGEVVTRAGVHVAGLRADDRRAGLSAPRRHRQRLGVHRPVGESGNDRHRAFAEAEQAHGPVDRRVALRADDDAHRRRAVEAVAPDVPTVLVSTDQRAAARPTVFAPCPPVANPTDADDGKPEDLLQPCARRRPRTRAPRATAPR